MIITEQFVMLNYPKTGSSFVRDVLKKIHRYDQLQNRITRKFKLVKNPPMIELLLPQIERAYLPGKGQHGCYRQIPEGHQHKKVVSVVRNPFERHVSGYLFGWWKRNPPASMEIILKEFPSFPDLTFREYCEFSHTLARKNRLFNAEPQIDLGVSTIQFINFYFKNPEEIINNINQQYIDEERYLDDLPTITFLHQENLNQELYSFLLDCNYPQNEVEFIQNAKRVNVTSRKIDKIKTESFYEPDIMQKMLQRNRLLFELFPEYKLT